MTRGKSSRRIWVYAMIAVWMFAFAQLIESLYWPTSQIGHYIWLANFVFLMALPSFNRGQEITEQRIRLLYLGLAILFSTSISTFWGGIQNRGVFAIVWGSLSFVGLMWVTTGLTFKGDLRGSRVRI